MNWHYRDVYAYNINSGTSYTAYKEALSTALGTKSLLDFTNVSSTEMLAHLTDSIHQAAKATIGFKINRKKRKSCRLPQPILALIKEKNLLVQQLKACSVNHTGSSISSRLSEIKRELDIKRNEVNEKIKAGFDPEVLWVRLLDPRCQKMNILAIFQKHLPILSKFLPIFSKWCQFFFSQFSQ